MLERLGRTLETVLQEEGPIPSATAARLGVEILDTLQHMHVNNVMYVDVKPENFMVDADKENKVRGVFLLYLEGVKSCANESVHGGIADLLPRLWHLGPLRHGHGQAQGVQSGHHRRHAHVFESQLPRWRQYVHKPTHSLANSHQSSLTRRPVLSLSSAAPSRRDDVEALLNVLIYLQLGSLSWQKASSDVEGAKIKKATSVDQLCSKLPVEWKLMLKKIRECGFEDKPDYEFFAKHFAKLGGKLGATEPFNWGPKTSKKVLSDKYALAIGNDNIANTVLYLCRQQCLRRTAAAHRVPLQSPRSPRRTMLENRNRMGKRVAQVPRPRRKEAAKVPLVVVARKGEKLETSMTTRKKRTRSRKWSWKSLQTLVAVEKRRTVQSPVSQPRRRRPSERRALPSPALARCAHRHLDRRKG